MKKRVVENIGNSNPSRTVVRTWHHLWLTLGVIAAAVTALIDAVLLQRKFNFFTGGFLSVNHLTGAVDTIVFITTSLVADIGVIVPIIALVLWLCSLIRLNLKASVLTALVAAIGPVMAVNFISYRILEYMGDVFDLSLVFELAGQNLTEVLTVASAHLVMPLSILLGALGLLILLIRVANRYWKKPLPPTLSVVRLGLQSGVIFLVALLVTCGIAINSELMDYGLKRKPSAKLFFTIGESFSDIDRDGYGLLRRPRDPAPFNSQIFPYAVEIPGNGIDENGVAGDLPVGKVPYLDDSISVTRWKSRPNIILIVLESFRADLIGMTYDRKPITPVLNRLAREGISTEFAFAHGGYTVPARYHIFSGRLLTVRGGTTLIDDFRANGYEVAYFSAQDMSFGRDIFNIGFDHADVSYDARVEPHRRYTDFSTAGSIMLPYTVMVEQVTNFLASRHSDKPLFLYVNLQDAHFPYHHRYIRPLLNKTALPRAEISPDRASDLWSTYVNTAVNVDFAVGEIFEAAKRFLGDPSPGIIVLADHGESLYDDGFLGHGFTINDQQTRIPLIVANLPIILEQPSGQIQLRGAINRALEREAGESLPLILKENPTATVFQYLGNLRRPSQIALRGTRGRIIYDFRTDRVRISGNLWRHPNELTDEEFSAFQGMVNLWERMIIAVRVAQAEE